MDTKQPEPGKYCNNCGIELAPDAKFCMECGAKQPEPAKYCNNCGIELAPNAKFCMECGTPVTNGAPTVKQKSGTNIDSEPSASQPLQSSDSNISVVQTDENTISVVLKGIPFNLKLVKGKKYGSDKEINDFYIGETPVTQALFMTVTGNNPSKDNEDINYPVTNITQALINSFFMKLQKETGVKFDLPTKKQWNFAYKGGNHSKGYDYSGSNDINEVGWLDDSLHPVGQLFANELGLLDMDGNVNELLKGDEIAPRSKEESDSSDQDSLNGFRIVFNYNADGEIAGNSPLQKILASKLPKLKSEWEKVKKENGNDVADEEALKSIKDKKVRERILSYKKRTGLIVYDNWKEIEENLGYLIPSQSGKLSLDSKKITWNIFGELALDEDEYELSDDFEEYEEDVEYTIINGNILVIKGEGDTLPEFPDKEWISENEDSNYYKLNAEIEQKINDITSVIILKEVTYTVGGHCFEGFKNLKYLFLSDSIDSVYIDDGFKNCKKLEKVFISSDTLIESQAFEGCSRLISCDDVPNRILKKAEKYKKQRGVILYSDYDEMKEVYRQIDPIAYEKNHQTEEIIMNSVSKHLSSSKTVWKPFGELAMDKDRFGAPPHYDGNVKYTLIDKKILVLKGNGNTPEFLIRGRGKNYWQLNEEMSTKITTLVVLDGIKEIRTNFCCTSRPGRWIPFLKTIILPNSLKEIGRAAFKGLYFMQFLNLPERLDIIEKNAFERWDELSSILIPPTVRYIKDYSFGECDKLKHLFIYEETNVANAILEKED